MKHYLSLLATGNSVLYILLTWKHLSGWQWFYFNNVTCKSSVQPQLLTQVIFSRICIVTRHCRIYFLVLSLSRCIHEFNFVKNNIFFFFHVCDNCIQLIKFNVTECFLGLFSLIAVRIELFSYTYVLNENSFQYEYIMAHCVSILHMCTFFQYIVLCTR
jgi:hypothetical protein